MKTTVIKVTMKMEIAKNSYEEMQRILKNHIDYLMSLDEFPEIESVFGVEVEDTEISLDK
jgi:hypothetical protein